MSWVVSVPPLIEATTESLVEVSCPVARAKRPVPPVIVATTVAWLVLPTVFPDAVPDPVVRANTLSPFAATNVKLVVPLKLFPTKSMDVTTPCVLTLAPRGERGPVAV